MKEFFDPLIIIPLAVIMGSFSIVAVTFIIVLRDKISGVHVSRSGVEIQTNDIPVWSKVVDRIERIDSNTAKSIRKSTNGLMMIDSAQQEICTETMLVCREANQPLIYAAYENHHTRDLKSDVNVYIADKAHDIAAAVRIWRKHFPELTAEKSHAYACLWVKKILLPNLRRACVDKIAYYTSQINRKDISKTIKEILAGCRTKNETYVSLIDTLAEREDIDKSIAVYYPLPHRKSK